jgi:crotonobetainyl-CoA:carnitine CoA-transferase CaiB-like acyl-CoA transferase
VTQLMEGIRVLELAGNVAGPFAGKLFADYGADVLKVEPPQGDPSRREGPFKDDIPDPEGSGLFLHLNTNKRSVTLKLATAEGQSIVRRLVAESDVVIEDFRPGQMEEWGLGYETLADGHPDLVMASITPFGQTGPWKDYRGSEVTLQAAGGPLHVNGAAYREPVKLGGNVAHYHAGLAAAYACILARFRVEAGGAGDHIDQAVYQAQAGFRDRRSVALTAASYSGYPAHRQFPGSRPAVGARPASDGYVNILAGGTRHFLRFLEIIGRPDLKEHPDAGRPVQEYSQDFAEQVEGSYLAWLAVTPKREAIAVTQAAGMLGGAIFSTEDLVTDPHYRERGVWETIDHPVTGPVEYPGRQLILSETPRQPARRAPLLGEHNTEVYVSRLGYSQRDLAVMRAQGVI